MSQENEDTTEPKKPNNAEAGAAQTVDNRPALEQLLDPDGSSEEKAKTAQKIKAAIRLVSPAELAADLFGKMPPVSSGADFETANPLPVHTALPSGSAGGSDAGSAPAYSLDDLPRDAKRMRFDPRRHLVDDAGNPETTDSGYWRNIPKKWNDSRIEANALRFEQANSQQAESSKAESGSEPVEPASESELSDHAGEWVTFFESVLKFFVGEDAAFKKEAGRLGEREAFTKGLEAFFRKARFVRFPALLGIALAGAIYAKRVVKWRPKPKQATEAAATAKRADVQSVTTTEISPFDAVSN